VAVADGICEQELVVEVVGEEASEEDGGVVDRVRIERAPLDRLGAHGCRGRRSHGGLPRRRGSGSRCV